MSVPRFGIIRDGQTVFSSIAADTGTGYILTGSAIRFSHRANMTANYFETLGVQPILGRLFCPRRR